MQPLGGVTTRATATAETTIETGRAWPQLRECLVCGEQRVARWAGDRLHNRCRRDLQRIDTSPEHRLASTH